MEKIIFYTKLNCHLCDEAYEILLEVINDIPLQIDVVDVGLSTKKDLMARYRERIPVIGKPGATDELSWPFTVADIRVYLGT